MGAYYQENEIDRGEESHSGHIVFKKAKIKSTNKKVIFKLNKYNVPFLSLYEVALSDVLDLFLGSYLTPKQTLVRNDRGEIIGLTSDHFCYSVALRETLESNFYSLAYDVKTGRLLTDSKKREKAEDIPIYFFNEFAPGFFADLYKASKEGQFDLDMDSLANVLCSSYTLEEDDLHKGNWGFYIVEKSGRKCVVFFKIDNDLLMSDSVISHYDSRILNWGHGEHAFKITARDLRAFPKLQDSSNHYWPTSRRYFVNYSDPKVYASSAEIEAFVELGKSPKFQQAKWKAWYKHILIQSSMINACLANSLNEMDANERAQIALISQATIARLSYLKAVLFSLPEFRNYVKTANHQTVLEEIQCSFKGSQSADLFENINEQMKQYQDLCRLPEGGFVEGDTPLHAAIRLGDYRYHETWGHFKEFANQTNANHESPLDIAMKLAQNKVKSDLQFKIEDVRQHPLFIAKHLLAGGVNKTASYREFLSQHPKVKVMSYRFCTSYLDKSKKAQTAEDLIEILRDLGEDSSFSLKMKKEISVSCLRYFLKNKKHNTSLRVQLTKLYQALNGDHGKEPRPELQFIRQLRSTLWIVRIIRGLLGGTSTQVQLNEIIDNTKKKIPPSPATSCCSCFFVTNKRSRVPDLFSSESEVAFNL
ncbi:Dot/Icm T4SS effector AnkK/LegA5 [Legionella cardiaca]|uniref:Ankyrin repeat domain-containing protein n=1 Tax=Legionella cardiaca TaxID=1071983 RepID=A0ABY8AQV6_9GAMM|nr:Dot/Icm T4SS effector AnkK/LegA5 [Legionella cardiaca]WED42159.1 ankyrin repeat domain-containing protein [Legionella cardiaca]